MPGDAPPPPSPPPAASLPPPPRRLSVTAPTFVPGGGGNGHGPSGAPASPATSAADTPPPGFAHRRGAHTNGASLLDVDDGPPGLTRLPATSARPAAAPQPPASPASPSATTPPLCAVCTEPTHAVSVGPCNHKAVCAVCALRLRLCYGNTRCALCQAALDEIVLARWRPGGPPDWGDYAARLGRLTARPGAKALHAHVAAAHAPGQLCRVCVDEGKAFVRDLPLHPNPAALRAHMDADHPACAFCGGRRFYSGDDLFAHMRAAHFTCFVCQRAAGGGTHHHEPSAAALTAHLRARHHVCEEPACEGAFAAFATADELAAHARSVHGANMPRFDRRAARVLPLELNGTVVPALACDADCGAAARRDSLAAAFGVDRAAHVPVFERPGATAAARNAGADYGPDLLHFAWHNRGVVAAMEALLAEFVADATAARRSAPPAPDAVRRALHALAPHYGVASQSFGAGARRHVELFKAGAGRAARPPTTLSAAAARLTEADVERAAIAAAGFPLVLCDVSPGADLPTLLQRFAGDYALEGPWDDGAAVARFRSAARLRAALDTLGGGMRGAFKVDRKLTLEANKGNGAFERAGAAAPAAAAAAPPPAAPPPRPAVARAARPTVEAAFEVTPPRDWGRASDFDWASET